MSKLIDLLDEQERIFQHLGLTELLELTPGGDRLLDHLREVYLEAMQVDRELRSINPGQPLDLPRTIQ